MPYIRRKAAGLIKELDREEWASLVGLKSIKKLFILGNPPFLGPAMQTKEQKDDKEVVFTGLKDFKNLDFVACWFIKAARLIASHTGVKAGFVSTNPSPRAPGGTSVGAYLRNGRGDRLC